MTIKDIITTQLDRISADSEYSITGNFIELTINDFEEKSKTRRELVNPIAVGMVLDWLEDYADYADGDDFRNYYFGKTVVEVSYSSFNFL